MIAAADPQTFNAPSVLPNSQRRGLPGDRSFNSISSGDFFRTRSPSRSHTISRSVCTILQAIKEDWEAIGPVKATSPTPGPSRQTGSTSGPSSSPEDIEPVQTDAHRRLRMRLSPLISMEENLNRKLFPQQPDPREISVRGGTNWKSYLARVAKEKEQKPPRPRSSQSTVPQEEGTHILVTFKEDIIALWSDPVVHRVLERRRCNVRDMPGLCVPSRSLKSET